MTRPCWIALLLLFAPYPSKAEEGERPNVLFLIADDLRNELGCYGGLAKTPHLDELAERGIRFDRAYCQKAVCWPSRNSFFSGLEVHDLGETNHERTFRVSHPDIASLPQWFKRHGWFTAGFGKILHNGQDDPASWSQPLFEPEPFHYALPENREKQVIINRAVPENEVNPLVERAEVEDEAYEDGRTTAAAVAALHERSGKDEPFFLMVGFHKPHSPFVAPAKYWDLYERDEIPLAPFPDVPAGAPERFVFHDSNYLRSFGGFPDEGPIPDETARKVRHAYLAATSYVDAQVGRLLATLEESGEAGNTIVVFTSDHGYHLGDHGLWSKHTTYELATRVPLIVAGPGLVGGLERSALVELLDLYPTLCDLAGLEKPSHLAGQSFAPLDPWSPARDAAYSEYSRSGATGRSIRTERYRYTEWRDNKTGKVVASELYDHEVDPGETWNLIDSTATGTISSFDDILRDRMNR